ncbi:MAG: YceI family protein [Planctomycetota bacterium]|nr:YceI family protein [Planctomycetota bacterium]
MLQSLSILGGLVLGAALLVPGPATAPSTTVEDGVWTIDAVHSTALFSAVHLGASRFYGRFNELSGEITFDPAKPEASSVKFTIPVDSVDTNSSKRDQHLRGPDFFSSKEFATASFESKSVKVAQKAADDKPLMLEVTGELELAGKKREVTAMVEQVGMGPGSRGGELVGFEARLTIQRSDFGIDYMLGGLSDDVQLILSVEAAR